MSQTHIELDFGNEYSPDVVSAPGETIQELINDRGMTQTELAERLGLAQKTVNEIVRGKAPLTHETALALETVLGIPASFWNRYEATYREWLSRKRLESSSAGEAAWVDTLPWRQAAKMGWIAAKASQFGQMSEVLRFFAVASPRQYDDIYGSLSVQWKRHAGSDFNPHSASFWLRRGELAASELAVTAGIQWREYGAREFEACLVNVRRLTRVREPKVLVPELQRLCAQAGVAVVFVPEIEGTRAGGATRWLSPSRALIQLSLRYRTNDALWFYFYHESCHVLKHSKRGIFVELDGVSSTNDEEHEADEFAQNLLIPPREYRRFVSRGKPTKASAEAFADEIGVDPGVVVGRLQHDDVIPRKWFNDLKQRYEWEIAPES